MPLVSFHGTGDEVNPYNGGGSPYWAYSIPMTLQRWAELDHCEDKPREQHVALHVTLLRYKRCAQGAEIWLYRTDAPGEQGGGHAWPGPVIPPAAATPEEVRANKPSTEINASELMWQFSSSTDCRRPLLNSGIPGIHCRGSAAQPHVHGGVIVRPPCQGSCGARRPGFAASNAAAMTIRLASEYGTPRNDSPTGRLPDTRPAGTVISGKPLAEPT